MSLSILYGPIWGDEACDECEAPAAITVHLTDDAGVDETYGYACREHRLYVATKIEMQALARGVNHFRPES